MKKRFVALLTVTALILCGCAQNAPRDESVEADVESGAVSKTADASFGLAADMEYSAPRDGVAADAPAEESAAVSNAGQNEISAGTLTAGEWKDNDNYDYLLDVLSRDEWKEYAQSWKINLQNRFAVTVSSGQNAAKNVKVEITDSKGEVLYTAVTDSYGKAYLYYGVDGGEQAPKTVRVYAAGGDDGYVDEAITEQDLKSGRKTVNGAGEKYTKLDLMFTTDTTASMSDELEYLKKELKDVITQVAADDSGLDIRVSVNFYRDEGDEYVVRDFAFDGDLEKIQKQLDGQFADGGNDFPEALHTALENSLKEHEWREDAVKLLFLTLDAPGHKETQGVIESIRGSYTYAAGEGIRIIPVASSGIDKDTEFLLRAGACLTGGTYTFLTDDSGVGDPHLEPTIGDYNVKKLNDLIVKIIKEYCK